MRFRVTARRMGGSAGATLPKETAARLHIEEQGERTVSETEEGLLITSYDPEFEEAMEAYEHGARWSNLAPRRVTRPGKSVAGTRR